MQVLPLARIKRIIKSEGDVKAVSSEASFAVARAAVSPSFSIMPLQMSVVLLFLQNMLWLRTCNSPLPMRISCRQELLLEELARRANVQMQSQHRSTLQYKDVGRVLCSACPCLSFSTEQEQYAAAAAAATAE